MTAELRLVGALLGRQLAIGGVQSALGGPGVRHDLGRLPIEALAKPSRRTKRGYRFLIQRTAVYRQVDLF
jgi:hypothetical protein